jgi:glucose-1-phosphatase
MKIKNIIFDLGGVLLDLDPQRSFDAIGALMDADPQTLYKENIDLFDGYEKGMVITENFLWHLQHKCKVVPESYVIIAAWNAMLVGWKQEKLDLLASLKDQYNLYLLSNTNEVHLRYLHADLKKNHQINDFEDRFFKKAYYSHLLKMRKPDAEIFNFVLEDACLLGAETLFIDDNIANVEGAQKCGIYAHHHSSNASVDIDAIISSLQNPKYE